MHLTCTGFSVDLEDYIPFKSAFSLHSVILPSCLMQEESNQTNQTTTPQKSEMQILHLHNGEFKAVMVV